jgi:hypothetical protein
MSSNAIKPVPLGKMAFKECSAIGTASNRYPASKVGGLGAIGIVKLFYKFLEIVLTQFRVSGRNGGLVPKSI